MSRAALGERGGGQKPPGGREGRAVGQLRPADPSAGRPCQVQSDGFALSGWKAFIPPAYLSSNGGHCELRPRRPSVLFQVVVFQKYTNHSPVPIEAKYVFPLSDSAAVCGFEAFINGKHVVGQVQAAVTASATFRSCFLRCLWAAGERERGGSQRVQAGGGARPRRLPDGPGRSCTSTLCTPAPQRSRLRLLVITLLCLSLRRTCSPSASATCLPPRPSSSR